MTDQPSAPTSRAAQSRPGRSATRITRLGDGPRAVGRRLGTAIGLAWQAGRWLLLGYAAVQALAGAVPVATAWLVKAAIDMLADGGGDARPVLLGVAFAATCLAGTVATPVTTYLQEEINRRVGLLAKDRLYAKTHRIALLSVLERPRFRDQLRLAEQASQAGPGQVISCGLNMTRSAITFAGMVGTVAVIAPWLVVVLTASTVPALIAEIGLSRRRASMIWRISPAERRGIFYSELLTNLSAAKEIRLFHTGRLFHRRMLAELAANAAERRRQDLRELAAQGCLAALSATLAGGALLWILVSAAAGRHSGGDVAAIVAAVGSMLTALSTLVSQAAFGHHASLLLDHYRAVLAQPHDPSVLAQPHDPSVLAQPHDPPAALAASPGPGGRGIELVDVWFRYAPGQPWVLRGVSLTLPPNQAIAFVGENGAGKSTLTKLLCRLYDPTRGVIRWDGVDIRSIPLPQLRQRIGAVFQDFMSYDLTAAENIALGDVDGADDLDTDPRRLTDPARRADVLDAIEALPSRWDTLLSRSLVKHDNPDEHGVLLSGGQWQRLALARGLLRAGRDLLILDEPSSGLDALAEHRIHRQLAEERTGRISVLVSHRLNTVRDADRIVVLDHGTIIEQGTHAELLAAEGTYARLFRVQARGYQLRPVSAGQAAPTPERLS